MAKMTVSTIIFTINFDVVLILSTMENDIRTLERLLTLVTSTFLTLIFTINFNVVLLFLTLTILIKK